MWEVLQDDDVLREQLNTSWSYMVRIISRSVTFTPVALVLCAGAGAWLLRTVSAYKILHDKVIVSDGWHTEVGSFNFSRATDRSNSENVLVVWDDPVVAQKYLNHWTSRWEQGTDWKQTY